jgi:site-specific DNA-cytosine methylase
VDVHPADGIGGSGPGQYSDGVVREVKLGSLFDGIAGFPYSASKLGIIPIWASEIEPFPIKVSSYHFPDMQHLGDITQINGAEIKPVDIITFGPPVPGFERGRQKGRPRW